jgi:antagonist of KipI
MTAPAAAAPILDVLKPGLLSSVQDQGRPGQARIALSRGGAMDPCAMALANALVGNAPDEAGIEITGPGPTLRFGCDAWIASVGALHRVSHAAGSAGGDGLVLPTGRPVFVPAGSVLRWQAPATGWRSWLAVAGGLALPAVMASRSSHVAAGLGPAPLAAGQRLPLAADAQAIARRRAAAVLRRADPAAGRPWPAWQVAGCLPRDWPSIDLPVLAGRHLDMLAPDARRALLEQTWAVSSQSNRQGMRLQGRALDTRGLPQLASEPVSLGTVQLPPSGEPVILLAEHQTTGGYPRILEAASAAEHLLAQAGAGCRIRFTLVGLEEADHLARQRSREFTQRLAGLAQACAYPPE